MQVWMREVGVSHFIKSRGKGFPIVRGTLVEAVPVENFLPTSRCGYRRRCTSGGRRTVTNLSDQW